MKRIRGIILLFLFIGLMINYADKSVSGYASIAIMKEFKLSAPQWGVVGSSFFWLFSLAAIVGGALSDKIGSKKMLTILLLAWTVLQLGAFAITGLTGLILYRILLGMFEGPSAPAMYSHVSKWFPKEQQGRALSILNIGAQIGAFLYAPIVVHLIHNFGWRFSFASFGVFSLLWVLFWIPFGKDKPVETKKPNLNISIQPKLKSSEIVKLVFSRNSIPSILALFACFWYVVWLLVWMPQYLVKVIHLSSQQMGYSVLSIGLCSMIISYAICTYSDILYKKSGDSRKSRVNLSIITMLSAGAMLTSILFIHSTVWVIVTIAFASGFVNVFLALGPQLLMSFSPERSGLMASLGTSFMNSAGIIGPIVTGYLIQSAGKGNVEMGHNYFIFSIIALLVVASILLLVFVHPDERVIKMAQENDQGINIV
ncbi:MFS transporter [Bacillus sp. AFS002410]|uniref:MFS transporter n=1 Tax=Bacillus sp. AFS002410 TaxID=2033481 RepID=UPI000BF06DB4|nr:MFS transporter [Bacillus sp. AFS002410]PEJ57632.1 MFS transporter [Bacillus sp. AFS002410]